MTSEFEGPDVRTCVPRITHPETEWRTGSERPSNRRYPLPPAQRQSGARGWRLMAPRDDGRGRSRCSRLRPNTNKCVFLQWSTILQQAIADRDEPPTEGIYGASALHNDSHGAQDSCPGYQQAGNQYPICKVGPSPQARGTSILDQVNRGAHEDEDYRREHNHNVDRK